MPAWIRSKAFRWFLTACALGFVGWSAWQLQMRWQANTVAVHQGLAIAGVGVGVLAAAVFGVAWVLLVRGMVHAPPPFSQTLSVFFTSCLGRYAPGRVGQAMLRISGFTRLGFSARVVATSMGVELISWGATGSCVAAVLLATSSADTRTVLGTYSPWIAGACILGLGVLATVDRARYPSLVLKLIGAEGSGSVLPWVMPLVHLGAWCLWALHGVVLAQAVGVTELPSAIYASAFFVLAPIAGVIALPMPAGVGVRESFMVLGLVPLVGAGNALTAALISRAASLMADVVLWLAFARLAGEANPANEAK